MRGKLPKPLEPRVAAGRFLLGAGLAALLFTTVTPPAVAAQPAHPAPAMLASRSGGSLMATQAALHQNDVYNFAPATGAVIPRSTTIAGTDIPTPLTSYNSYGLQKEVFAFGPYWALADESTWDYRLMSTITYFAITLNFDGTWYTQGGGWQGYFSQDLVDMINRAH